MAFDGQSTLSSEGSTSSPRGQRNYCIDFIKGLACICVVFMHCEFPGRLGMYVQAVSRFCVPFFFMVSGYFSYCEDDGKFKAGEKIGHIGKITLFASMFYLFIAVARLFVSGTPITFSLTRIYKWIIFNQPVVIAGHLWFLFALLYDYILYAIVVRLHLRRFAYWTMPVLLIVYIVMAQGAHLCGVKVPNMFYRNFLIEGFFFFMLGNWLRQNESLINEKLNNRLLWIVLVTSTLACLGERLLLGRDFGVNIFTFPQVFSIFAIGMRNELEVEHNPLSFIGSKLSMYVYVIHIFVWSVLVSYAYSFFHISHNCIALYLKPIFVLFVTLLMSYAIVLLSEHSRKTTSSH